MSLRTKLILAFSILVAGLVLFLVYFINQSNYRQVQDYILRGGMYGFDKIVTEVEDYYRVNKSWDGIDEILESSQPSNRSGNGMGGMNTGGNGAGMGETPKDSNKFTITDTNLVVIWSSAGEEVGSTLSSEAKKNALSLETAPDKVFGYLIVSGREVVQVSELSPLIENLRTQVLRSGLLAGIAAIIMAILFSYQLIRPVKLLTKAADTLANGNLAARVKVSGRDEIARLSKSFNAMAENLESAESRKKALTADIAHELRSPLAVQKAQLEAMQDGIVPMNQDNLQTIVDQTNFLTRLVDDLRTLALVDAGELPLELDDVNLVKLIGQVVDRFIPQAAKQEVDLFFHNATGKEELHFDGDPDRLTQVIGNLISNALHHTPAGGKIEVVLNEDRNSVSTTVLDNGCGIPEADLPHLFERFYRGDKSRNRENSSSTGLGLSIARHLARVHGGELTARNAEDHGAIFTMTLPKIRPGE